jgi:cobalamin biosynthesis protein CobT
MALKLAKFAVNTTPSEFLTWAKLTEVYIDLEDYKNALLTLNSCPMFTYSERDMHRMPAPMKTHLPIKAEIMNSGIMEEDAAGRENEADPNLSRLPAPALHGTFAKAYALLTRLASKIGWDDLLKCRSQVFVMEEEYRMQKAKEDTQKSSASINEQEHALASHLSTDQQSTVSTTADALVENKPKNEEEETAESTTTKVEETINEEEAETVEKEEKSEEAEETDENKPDVGENADELADQMDTVDLNADEEGTAPVEVHHTPLVRPEQIAEDPSKVTF